MSFGWEIYEQRGIETESMFERPLDLWASTTVNVAETATIKVPNDKFIHQIHIYCAKGTVSGARGTTAVDEISEVRFVCDGNKYYKKMTGIQTKEVMRKNNFRTPTTGFYTLFFTDELVKEAWPLPAWLYTSISLQIDLLAAAATYYNSVDVTTFETDYKNQDLTNAKILIETYAGVQAFGTATGEQKYEHDRAYKIFSYIYECADGVTLSDTKFDYLSIQAFTKEGRVFLKDKVRMVQIKENNTNAYMSAPATGMFIVDFPMGLPAYKYTNLRSILNIPTAGTNINVKVLERYVL